MSPTRERQWLGAMASCLAWSLAVIAFALPIYVWVADANQGIVVRFASALIVGIVLLQAHHRVRTNLDGEAPSPFDLARDKPGPTVRVDPQFSKLHSELEQGLANRRYFDHVVWPRLVALAERQGLTLRRPLHRWPARRGPGVRAIADLVSSLEHES
jgi:hypothetical protein